MRDHFIAVVIDAHVYRFPWSLETMGCALFVWFVLSAWGSHARKR